jgi:hypothetical protein
VLKHALKPAYAATVELRFREYAGAYESEGPASPRGIEPAAEAKSAANRFAFAMRSRDVEAEGIVQLEYVCGKSYVDMPPERFSILSFENPLSGELGPLIWCFVVNAICAQDGINAPKRGVRISAQYQKQKCKNVFHGDVQGIGSSDWSYLFACMYAVRPARAW